MKRGSKYHDNQSAMPAGNAVVQLKLSVGATNDPMEYEADAMADKVMRMPENSFIQRKSSGSGSEYDDEHIHLKPLSGYAVPSVQAKSDGGGVAVSDSVAGGINSTMGGGSSMDKGTKSFMESRFGADFGGVKIHDGSESAQLNRSLNAKAFTVNNNIYFNSGQYQPETDTGKHLLAHELTHVIQQKHNGASIARKVNTYRTSGITVTGLDSMADIDYWVQKFGDKYTLTFDPRMNKDAEEKHAVLSTAWSKQPAHLTKTTEVLLLIPAANRPKGSKSLLYKATFEPKDPKVTGDTDKASFAFMGEDVTNAAVSSAPAGFTAKGHNITYELPENFFDTYPDVKQEILSWIEGSTLTDINTILTTEVTVKNKKKVSKFLIKGTKNGKGTFDGDIKYLSADVIDAPVDAGYNDKDFGDLQIEKAQKSKDFKLGAVDVSKVPKDEQFSVKYFVAAYADKKASDTEVDVIVPIAKTNRKVLYTFRYIDKTNDVEIERIGELDKQVKITGVSVQNAVDFSSNNKDAATLKTWLGLRYPGLSVKNTALPDIIKEADTQLQAKIKTADWFKANYGIELLGSSDAEDRWQKIHGWKAPQTGGMKDYSSDELLLIEEALQSQSQQLLGVLKGVKMTRQDEERDPGGSPTHSTTSGFTSWKGTDRTIIIYDRFKISNDTLFMGSASNAFNSSLETIVHEMGHAVSGGKKGLEDAFNKFVKTKKIKPVTSYAATGVNTESFPEAYALFHLDPQWMRTNIPDLYTWFDTLSKTGKAP